MIALGTQYLPFLFLYGMWQFGVLAGVLWAAGFLPGLYAQALFSLGGWVTAVVLMVFAIVGPSTALRDGQSAGRVWPQPPPELQSHPPSRPAAAAPGGWPHL
jgi:hypothetical protein